MPQPLVSIITPAYNAAKYVGQTIDSVLAQTYPAWEMVIVNDCSTDDTRRIVEAYSGKDQRIHLVNAPRQGGVSAARNLALTHAKGRFIAFLDSDDRWLPDKLSLQIEYMLARGAAFTFTSYRCMDDGGAPLDRYVYARPRMTYRDVLKNTLIGCLTVVVDREQTGDFSMPLIHHSEDTMTWVEILKRGYVAEGLPDVLAEYRIASNSLTRKKLKVARMHWTNLRKHAKLGVPESVYCFVSYAFNAVRKGKRASVRNM